MKKSKTLSIEYSGLSDLGPATIEHLDDTIRDFLMWDSLVLYYVLNLPGANAGSSSKISYSNILAKFGNSVIDYDSRKILNENENKVCSHCIHLNILSENPEKAAAYIRRTLFGALVSAKAYRESEYDELLTPFMLGTEQLFLRAYSKEELNKVYKLLTAGRGLLYDKASFMDKKTVDNFADVLLEKIIRIQNGAAK